MSLYFLQQLQQQPNEQTWELGVVVVELEVATKIFKRLRLMKADPRTAHIPVLQTSATFVSAERKAEGAFRIPSEYVRTRFEPTEEWRSEGRGRPAQLFRYAPTRRRNAPRGVRFE